MITLGSFVYENPQCSYLPDRSSQLEYVRVAELTAAEYEKLMNRGWRRFGHYLFRPICQHCQLCQPLRIDVPLFQPNRSQRRAIAANRATRRTIGTPECTP
ncbi:MAG: arginyltransferase, partial [Gemmataceae bacterium]